MLTTYLGTTKIRIKHSGIDYFFLDYCNFLIHLPIFPFAGITDFLDEDLLLTKIFTVPKQEQNDIPLVEKYTFLKKDSTPQKLVTYKGTVFFFFYNKYQIVTKMLLSIK